MTTRSSKSGELFVVATPIGHLDDLSARAVKVLSKVDEILAEDTRRSRVLLQHYGISTSLSAYHDHNESRRVGALVTALAEGKNIALISDAGTPLLNDPGFPLVRAAQDAGVRVTPVPGPSALLAALSVCGLPVDQFCFQGFLPARSAARRAGLQALVGESRTMVFLESSHRIAACLKDMAEVFGGEREACLARELTKRFETVRRAALAALLEWVEADADQRRGEFVIVVGGAKPGSAAQGEVDRILDALLARLPPRQAAELAANILNDKKNRLYRRALVLNQTRNRAGKPAR